jgi:hypothetical protein
MNGRTRAPWSAYLILPLFAFSATGVSFAVDLSSPRSRKNSRRSDLRTCRRQAARHRTGRIARDHFPGRRCRRGNHSAQFHRRGMPLRRRLHRCTPHGGSGISARRILGARQDRVAGRFGVGCSTRCCCPLDPVTIAGHKSSLTNSCFPTTRAARIVRRLSARLENSSTRSCSSRHLFSIGMAGSA